MYHPFAFNFQNSNHISFIKDPNLKNEIRSIQAPFNYYHYRRLGKYLYLLDTEYPIELFNVMPKLFTITTNQNIPYKFNIEMLKDTSLLISELLSKTPDCLHYHLNIDDEFNVLEKFSKMYQGEEVTFKEDDLPTSRKIIKLLEMEQSINPSNFMTLKSKKEMNFGLHLQSFLQYLRTNAPKTFKIKTNKKEYNCNIFGVYSSKILSSLLEKDLKIDTYEYDFDDELDEFQLICDIFNFKEIKITSSNMNSLNEMVNDFQITLLIEKISNFVEDFEKVSQKIDDEQIIVEMIEEIFSWLYQIKELSVEKVKNYIIESDWIQTDENVQELAAFLLQVIDTDSTYHPYIIDLIIQLTVESNEIETLKILIPFIVQKLMISLGESLLNCSFIYNLYKKGIISKDYLKMKLKQSFMKNDDLNNNKKSYIYSYNFKDFNFERNKKSIYLICWFYPELNEIDEIRNKVNFPDGESFLSFIHMYFPSNIEGYYKMRDSGEPDDEITRALRYDDVDTFQSLLIKNGVLLENSFINTKNRSYFPFENQKTISKATVPFNLYEDFVPNGTTNYINYACAYGSLKCFKYLLLNHEPVDRSTFELAVFGGNIEIIKTVFQNIKLNESEVRKYFYVNNELKIVKFPAIIKHRNDIFDWIFQVQYKGKTVDDEDIYKLLVCAAKSGNAHALIEIIDEGINSINNSHDIINSCARNGFYLFTKLFINIFKTKKNDMFLDYSSSVYFGNLSIFKLYHENIKTKYDINSAIALAIERNYVNIIHYFFQNLINEFKIKQDFIFACLKGAIVANNDDLFNYLIEQFRNINQNFFKKFKKENDLLSMSCLFGTSQITKTLTDLIIANNPGNDFTIPFFNASISGKCDIVKYFIDMKLFINYEKLSYQVNKLSSISDEIFSLINENADSESREIFLNTFLEKAITKNNKGLIKYLFQKGAECEHALFIAIDTHDIELVNLILEYRPSYINKRSKSGTILFYAVQKDDLKLVKRLLKVPGIDPGLYEHGNTTPLISAVFNLNLDIINEILDFYGDKIQNETKQFDEALRTILKVFPKNNHLNQPYNNFSYFDQNYQMWGTYPNNNSNNAMQNREQIISVLKRLLEIKTIDPNCRFDSYTLLLYACEYNEIEMVQMLLQLEKIDVNFYFLESGDTPLIVSIKKQNLEITELLINHPSTNINMKNYQNETALTIAVSYKLDDIVDLLINNEKFNPNESNINYAFFLASDSTAKKLISSKSLDVNYKIEIEIIRNEGNSIERDFKEFKKSQLNYYLLEEEKSYITTLIDAINNNYIEKISMIINHESFNQAKSQLKKSIFVSVEKNRLNIFQLLIKLVNNDVNIFNCDKESLLYVAVKNKSKEIISEILKDSHFDSKKSDLLSAFNETIINNNNESMNIMNELYNYDKEHDNLIDFTNLLPNGRSFFTLIASTDLFQNEGDDCDDLDFVSTKKLDGIGGIVFFLLEHGVDPNKPDEDDFYPLEYAILLNSYDFVYHLIKSNRIDYSQKVTVKEDFFRLYENQYDDLLNSSDSKTKSYLHLAARAKNPDILKEFIVNKLIDINSTDECNETVLMEACRFNRIENVQTLSQIDDLDYLHQNDKGKDTVEIIFHMVDEYDGNPEVKTKDDYFNTLIQMLNSTRHSEKYEGENYGEEEHENDSYDDDDYD